MHIKLRVIGLRMKDEDINKEKHAGGFKYPGYIIVLNLGSSIYCLLLSFKMSLYGIYYFL